ncbi:YfcC family protein [Flaviaesturariibacter flavus]|uniref:YfcC family protein n=1 Tax=Flaviaesturariibacter flavus TaxID=2502780 RepID=A0A4R1B326_9BACT|nr:YfcC family protein [Flaviaesturariibacter flavus]TCJ12444.1 YfcC family protein [Flaviaesturariibacter flavus]
MSTTKRKIPSPITILMIVIVLAAIATLLLPAGKYETLSYTSGSTTFTVSTPRGDSSLPFSQATLDALGIRIPLQTFADGGIRKPVSIPGTYTTIAANRQGPLDVLRAPVKGIYDSIDIILFILVIGGFMSVFNGSGALIRGLSVLSYRMKGRESWLIVILTFLFSFGGASYGMAEESLAFYPVLVPLFLAAGYDLIVPVMVLFGGTQLGTLASFSNPFSTIIASNAAGVSWKEGLNERLLVFAVTTIVAIVYTVRYAQKVKRNPQASYVWKVDGKMPEQPAAAEEGAHTRLAGRDAALLTLFLGSFGVMIYGVVKLDWWLTEMTMLFLGAAILLGVILRMPEKEFIGAFLKGAEELLSVAFIVGIARGVTIILNDGAISDTILFYTSRGLAGFSPLVFILLMFALYILFTLFISSSSGMAVLTMPIMGALGIMAGVPGREMVNAYLYGMGIMGFLTPTGLILPSLQMVNVSYAAWWRFIRGLLLWLIVLCILFLLLGVTL